MKTWSDRYIRVEIDPAKRLVRHIRSAQRYDELEELERSLDAIAEQMKEVPRAEYVLLQDMRAAPGRNDPKFEKMMAQGRPRISAGFRKVGVLVATHVGRLQIQRYLESDNLTAKVFLEEPEAMRWLAAS